MTTLSKDGIFFPQLGQRKSLSSRCVWMHSSQYSVPQHGVLTASLKSLLSIGQVREASVGARSRTSAAVNPFGRDTCFCHAALGGNQRQIWHEFTTHVRIRLCDNIPSLGCYHHALAAVRIVHRLEKASRDTGSSLYSGLVVKLSIVVGGAVVYPMPFGFVLMQELRFKKSVRKLTFLSTSVAHITWW